MVSLKSLYFQNTSVRTWNVRLFSVNSGNFFLPLDIFKKFSLLKESKKITKKVQIDKKSRINEKNYCRYVFDHKSSSGDLSFVRFKNWWGKLFIVGVFPFRFFFHFVEKRSKFILLVSTPSKLYFKATWKNNLSFFKFDVSYINFYLSISNIFS